MELSKEQKIKILQNYINQIHNHLEMGGGDWSTLEDLKAEINYQLSIFKKELNNLREND